MKTICVYSDANWILKASVFLRTHAWCLVTARSCSRWCARCLRICVCVSVYAHFSSVEYRWERMMKDDAYLCPGATSRFLRRTHRLALQKEELRGALGGCPTNTGFSSGLSLKACSNRNRKRTKYL